MRESKCQSTDLVALRGKKNCLDHAHKTEFWYHLGVKFKISDNHLRHFYMGAPPPPPQEEMLCYVKKYPVEWPAEIAKN